MKEQFDKTLRNHIKDTFGSYNDQYASDGWNKLVYKKRRKKRALVFWYALPSGIAAALAIVWMYNWNTLIVNPATSNKMIVKTEKSIQNQKNDLTKDNLNKTIISAENNQVLSNTKTVINTNKEKLIAYNTNPEDYKSDESIVNENSEIIENKIEINKDNNLLLSILNDRKSNINVNDKFLVTDSNSTFLTTNLNTTATSNDEIENLIPRETEIKIPQKSRDNIAKKLYPNQLALNKLPASPSSNNNAVKQSKFNVSVDANTYYSFSERGVNDQVNLGLGLATTYKISKNLSINSGVLLNRQTSSFEGLDKSNFNSRLAVNSTFAIVPNAQITNAKLIGLDIPLNIQYNLQIGKAKTFITSGFSSYSVINEEYINDFSVTNYNFTGVNTSNITTVQDNPAGSFTYFKFARTLNFSFGVQYPLKGKSSFSVEPFVKYPIAGFGYQDLMIGSGGLSLKFNFNK
jgi:hypothetical protein